LPVFGGVPGLSYLGTGSEAEARRELEKLQVLESRSLIGDDYA
jgi:hypothetical protein